MLDVRCPNCGSSSLRCLDVVQQTTRIASWKRDEVTGVVEHDELDELITTHYETARADAIPYDCADCFAEFGSADLVVRDVAIAVAETER